jgi:hypothetical protein
LSGWRIKIIDVIIIFLDVVPHTRIINGDKSQVTNCPKQNPSSTKTVEAGQRGEWMDFYFKKVCFDQKVFS